MIYSKWWRLLAAVKDGCGSSHEVFGAGEKGAPCLTKQSQPDMENLDWEWVSVQYEREEVCQLRFSSTCLRIHMYLDLSW